MARQTPCTIPLLKTLYSHYQRENLPADLVFHCRFIYDFDTGKQTPSSQTRPMLKKQTLSTLTLLFCLLFSTFAQPAAGEGHPATSRGQAVYVPAYSHIYHGNRESPLLLTVTISIRNVSPTESLTVTSVDYYDTKGGVVKKFITTPFVLGPFASERFVVPQNDEVGGSGANFIVKWHSSELISPPIIETIMIGSQNQLGISFTSRGQAIYK